MEGMSRVTDHRECWPVFPEYWRSGRRKFTDETKAAAAGLLQGGASAVYVVNGHGLGWPNLLWAELPDGSHPADDEAWSEGFDATFMVGFHSRYGTSDGFVSHTMVPGLRVSVDGRPVTEPHIWAWLSEVPVLGVTGDQALGGQLDGMLDETPFLAVKRSTGRAQTAPVHAKRAESYAAIHEFACDCATRPLQPLPTSSPFQLEVGMAEELARAAEGAAGLEPVGPGVLVKTAEHWGRDAQPALVAAMSAALQPLREAEGDLDLSSQESMERQDPKALARYRQYLCNWVDSG